MVETIANHLEAARQPFVGRAGLVAGLLEFARGSGPVAAFVHGPPGIGKSELVAEVANRSRAEGLAVSELDCGAIEPTQIGVLSALREVASVEISTLEEITDALSTLFTPALIIFDGYESWRLIDQWVRDELLPRLPAGVRILIASRYEPASPWRYESRWQSALSVTELMPLNETEAMELVHRLGVSGEEARRLNAIARGHPLALTLSASLLHDSPGTSLEDAATAGVVEALAGAYLDSVGDRRSRAALEAASVTRRVTLPVLTAQLGPDAAEDAFRRLRALPFVRTTRDGLAIQQAAREAISARLKAAHPARHRELRRAAWRQLQVESRGAGVAELWRYTADILYLLQNPVLREGFFPSSAETVVMEPARTADFDDVRRMSLAVDGPDSTAILDAWLELRPDLLSVARDRDGSVVGFRWSIASDDVSPELATRDPVLASWLADLARAEDASVPAFFLRRWMSIEGEAPGEVQGLCWIDCKRSYMEMRPRLGHVYVAMRDFDPYVAALSELGFRDLPLARTELDGRPLFSQVSRLGAGSIDGWLSRLVARELGIDTRALLDDEARQLTIDGQRIPLTPLEVDVIRYLLEHRGNAVSHADLVEAVWGYRYTGQSNVDAVAIRALRAKLGPHASLIETVRGTGYRLRDE